MGADIAGGPPAVDCGLSAVSRAAAPAASANSYRATGASGPRLSGNAAPGPYSEVGKPLHTPDAAASLVTSTLGSWTPGTAVLAANVEVAEPSADAVRLSATAATGADNQFAGRCGAGVAGVGTTRALAAPEPSRLTGAAASAATASAANASLSVVDWCMLCGGSLDGFYSSDAQPSEHKGVRRTSAQSGANCLPPVSQPGDNAELRRQRLGHMGGPQKQQPSAVGRWRHVVGRRRRGGVLRTAAIALAVGADLGALLGVFQHCGDITGAAGFAAHLASCIALWHWWQRGGGSGVHRRCSTEEKFAIALCAAADPTAGA